MEPLTVPASVDGMYVEKLAWKSVWAAALMSAVSCLRQLSKPVIKTASASEILSPVRDSVKALRKSLKKSNGGLAELCDELVKELDDALVGAVKTPLAYHTKTAEAIKTFKPMYEEDG